MTGERESPRRATEGDGSSGQESSVASRVARQAGRVNGGPTCPNCGDALAGPMIDRQGDEEGYCPSCQKMFPWPAVDDDEGSAKAHQLGPLATTERRQERSEGQPSPAEPILVTVADVEREEVAWLWPGYIPKGRLTIIDGDPGVGKSWLALAIAAAVTTGAPWPGQAESREAANVLVLTAEDGIADTIRPRLEDMGADLRRVRVLTGVQDSEGQQRHPSLVDDLPVLDGVLAQGGYDLVVIDPVNAYLGTSLDTHRDAALRSVLTPLALLAERWKVAIPCIRHLTKSPRDRAIYRGQGSIAYCAAARTVHLVGVNPNDPTERVITCIKNNLAPEPPSLAFEITEGRFLWRGETSVSAAALLAPDSGPEERGALAEAQDFLRDLLTAGAVDAEEGWRQARKLGIAERTLKRARAALGIKARREGFGPGGRWVWEAPPVEGHTGPNPIYKDGRPPVEGSDTRAPQEGQELAPCGADVQNGATCPHRPLCEVEDRWRHADPDAHACACCGGPVGPDQWQDGLCAVCRNGQQVKEGSGHLVRLALDMGARLVEKGG